MDERAGYSEARATEMKSNHSERSDEDRWPNVSSNTSLVLTGCVFLAAFGFHRAGFPQIGEAIALVLAALAALFASISVYKRSRARPATARSEHELPGTQQPDTRASENRRGVISLETASALIASSAHEIGNHLTALRGHLLSLKEERSAQHLGDRWKPIEGDLERAFQAVRKSRALFRLSTSEAREPIRVANLVDETLDVARAVIKARGRTPEAISLDTDVDDSLVIGARDQLRQVLMNLIINSIINSVDAMPDEGRLGIRARTVGDDVVISVVDTGAGIATADIAKIFEPFFTTKGSSGMGLGLALSKSIVEEHLGSISCRSEPGVGTSFTVKLPSAKEHIDTPPTPQRRTRDRGRVLVIDDEAGVLQALVDILEHGGYDVISFASPIDAVAALTHDRFDVVVTDLAMPGMSGFDVAGRVKAMNPRTPVIMVTGFSLPERVESEVKARGVDVVLEKPFRTEELLDTVNEVSK